MKAANRLKARKTKWADHLDSDYINRIVRAQSDIFLHYYKMGFISEAKVKDIFKSRVNNATTKEKDTCSICGQSSCTHLFRDLFKDQK